MDLRNYPPPYGRRPYPLAPPIPNRGGGDAWQAQPAVLDHPGVVGSLWPPPAEAGPPPALMEWRRRTRRPLWAWSGGSVALAVAAAASLVVGGVLVLR
ncbi:MAG: hypothetical protein KDC23_07715 [Actinobacteria bacterium]|nr:hypothetical protein [Actinomycetota bacterium]